MPRRMRSAGNNVTTTLNGAVTDSATSWTVTDGSVFPATGDFYLARGAEIVLCTARATNVLTVIRGRAGTTAEAHGDGSSVTSILTAEELEARQNEYRRKQCLNYGSIRDVNGDVLTASDFTAVGSTAPGIVDGNGGIVQVRLQATGTNEGRMQAASRWVTANVDHRVIAHFGCNTLYDHTQSRIALWSRSTSGGVCRTLHYRPQAQLVECGEENTWLNNGIITNTGSCHYHGRNDMWARWDITWNEVASTDYIRFYFSTDGVHWFHLGTRSAAMSGFWLGVGGSNGRSTSGTTWDGVVTVDIYSWYEELL